MISRVALIVWFALYGINYFYPIKDVLPILAIVALIEAVALILNK